MTPKEVRDRVVKQHQELRERLAVVIQLVEGIGAGQTDREAELRERAGQLASALIQHMAAEEQALEPLLAGIEARGPARLEHLKHEHAHQRAILTSFRSRVDHVHPAQRLAELAEALASAVLLDMEQEEKELLDLDFLGGKAAGALQAAG